VVNLNKGEWGEKGQRQKAKLKAFEKTQLAHSKYDLLQKKNSYLLQISNYVDMHI